METGLLTKLFSTRKNLNKVSHQAAFKNLNKVSHQVAFKSGNGFLTKLLSEDSSPLLLLHSSITNNQSALQAALTVFHQL